MQERHCTRLHTHCTQLVPTKCEKCEGLNILEETHGFLSKQTQTTQADMTLNAMKEKRTYSSLFARVIRKFKTNFQSVGKQVFGQTFASSCDLYLWVCFIVKLLCSDPSPHQVISYSVSQGKVIIPGCRNVSVFHQSEVQVTIEALLQLRHILHSHDPPDADLLALLLVSERFGHAGWAGLCCCCCVCPERKVQFEGKMVAGFHAAVSSFCCFSLVSAGGGCCPGRPLLSCRAEQQEKVHREGTDMKSAVKFDL